jgi:hypothetical protein
MKSLLSSLVLVSALLLSTAAPAAANPLLNHEEFQARAQRAEALAERVKRVHTYEKKLNKLRFGQTCWRRRGPTLDVPELDPGAASGALALLLGGTLVLVDRRKRLLAL